MRGLASLADSPWLIEPSDLDLTADEQVLIHHILVGRYDGYSMIYGAPERVSLPSETQMRCLSSLGVLTFTTAREGGWDPGMWRARLTCIGANFAARHDGQLRLDESAEPDLNAGPDATVLDGHPGCGGGWRPDGTCTACRALRPLDLVAYRAYLDALPPDVRAIETRGPLLYCIEHGYLRQRHVTTQKTCPLRGTDVHDRSLYRVGSLP